VSTMKKIIADIEELQSTLSGPEKVKAFNGISAAIGRLVAGVVPQDPALSVQLIPTDAVIPNEYNPNNVASVEMDLLEKSIQADGVTMPVVVAPGVAPGQWDVVDGFHRQSILRSRLWRTYIPCSVIDGAPGDRMASTIRHNRARGKHQIDLMAVLVRSLVEAEWDNAKIADSLGMSEEELLRLFQATGIARIMANARYSRSFEAVQAEDS
jgi:ParB-like chromosome segregation protein Spo0J